MNTVMDDCGAVLHNIETKWLYDFQRDPEKCRTFSQAAVSRNVSATSNSAAASVRAGTGDWC